MSPDGASYEFRYRSIVERIYPALAADAFYRTMENTVADDPREAMLRYLDFSMREAHDYGVLHVAEGETDGASLWNRPLDAASSQERSAAKASFIARHMGPASLDSYERIVSFMATRSREHVPAESWYLSIVAVSLASQSRGLGTRLVEAVLDEADAAGAPTYLETFTRRNRPFYQRLGYREAIVVLEPTTACEYALMTRPPGARGTPVA